MIEMSYNKINNCYKYTNKSNIYTDNNFIPLQTECMENIQSNLNCCKINTCYNYKNTSNIYKDVNFIPLPTERAAIPPPMQIYIPLDPCGRPYPTPTYYPPAPCCNGIIKDNCECSGTCGKC